MKNTIYYVIVFISTTLLGIGCASVLGMVKTQEGMDTWLGASENQFLTVWGPPNSRDTDGAGGKILTYYVEKGTRSGSAVSTVRGNSVITNYNAPRTDVYTLNLYVSGANKIYNWRCNAPAMEKGYVNPYK